MKSKMKELENGQKRKFIGKLNRKAKILVYLAVAAVATTGIRGTYAIYHTQETGSITTSVAKFDFNVVPVTEGNVNFAPYESDGTCTKEYRFAVKAISEVDSRYSINLKTYWNDMATDDVVREEHAGDRLLLTLYSYDADWSEGSKQAIGAPVQVTMDAAADFSVEVPFFEESLMGHIVAPIGGTEAVTQNYGVEVSFTINDSENALTGEAGFFNVDIDLVAEQYIPLS